MSANITSVPSSFDTQLYCLDTSILPLDQCPGICVNPDVSGYPAVISFIAASVVTGLAMVWLPKPGDRRHQFYLQYIQSFSRITSAFVFLIQRKINTYDVYLIVLLVLGSETTAFVGAASLLHIVEYPYHLGILKPLSSIILVIALATIASPNTNWLKNEAAKAASLIGQDLTNVRGSQPACNFTFKKLFFIPLAFLTAVCLISVISSKTTPFARLVKKMPTFGNSATTKERAELKARVLWSLFIVVIDLIWIMLVALFIRSYMNVSTVNILNKDNVTKITPSQLFSIFLSATSLVPPIKHFLEQAKHKLGLDGEGTRGAVVQMYIDIHGGDSNEKEVGNDSGDSSDNGMP